MSELHSFTSLLLSEAVFCANCEMISNSTTVCQCCGSSAVLNLSQLLGGSLRNVQKAVLLKWPEASHGTISMEGNGGKDEPAAA